jgi:FixJ family two-component response regulator
MSPPVTPEPTVYVVEDDAAVRESLLLLLQLKGIAATGFPSADDFLAAVHPAWPGCLLLDLRMPGTGGLELQAMLGERGIALPVVIITAHGDVTAARKAFIGGAVDFLEKPLDETALLAAVGTALQRDHLRRDADAAAARRDARIARLSRREQEVMWLAGAGKQNRDIAATLGLSPRTVEIYKARMLEKLQIRGLPELLRFLEGARRNDVTN